MRATHGTDSSRLFQIRPSRPCGRSTWNVTHKTAYAPLLLLTPLRGSTHVAARVANARGNVAYDGTIAKGDQPVAIRGRRLWVQIDSPENLRVEVRGKLVHVPGQMPRVIVVTPTGWRPA